MAQLPAINESIQLPVLIEPHSHLFDHTVNGKTVLPAVEAMSILVQSATRQYPALQPGNLRNASFEKFLEIKAATVIEAINRTERTGRNTFQSTLQTKVRFKSGITRTLVHASIQLTQEPIFGTIDELAETDAMEGDLMPVETVYREIVPFGKEFQNLQEPFKITGDGATARVYGGQPTRSTTILGSPYPLDAAFHAACAWGKHHHGITTFPIGFAERRITAKTEFNQSYTTQIRTRHRRGNILTFDLAIRDTKQNLCETVLGLQMKEIIFG